MKQWIYQRAFGDYDDMTRRLQAVVLLISKSIVMNFCSCKLS
jgi:hypothetical protein